MQKIFVIAALIFMVACAPEQKVVIVSTNDIHSSIDNFPRLATLVEELRRGTDGEVLLVDAGDRWTGNPFVDMSPKPFYPIVELMNELGYDFAALGNHEFDWGQKMLARRTAEMTFPVVGANIDTPRSPLPDPAPYKIVEAGGMRIALVGLTGNFKNGLPDGNAEDYKGLVFDDVFDTAEKYAALKDSVDVMVGLTHLGFDADTLLARRVPVFDVIIGGHSHTELAEPVKVGGTVVTQTGSKLRYAGVTTIIKKGKELTITNRLVALDGLRSSLYFQNMVDGYNDDPALNAPIGYVSGEFDVVGVKNFVTDAIRAATRADLVLYHGGGIRVETLPETLSYADLYRIEPFFSRVYTMTMPAGDIKGLIMAKFNDTANTKESHAPDLFPSGGTYKIFTDESGEAVDVVLRPSRKAYTVAMPDYVYTEYSFNRPDSMRLGRSMPLVTDILRDRLEASAGAVVPDNELRIEIE